MGGTLISKGLEIAHLMQVLLLQSYNWYFFTGKNSSTWANRQSQPLWWPENIPFLDPNNAGKKKNSERMHWSGL